MIPRTMLAVLAALSIAWSCTQSGMEFADLGDGLLMRADGSVIAAYELPGVDVTGGTFDVPERTAALQVAPANLWQSRDSRGW